MIYKVLSIYRKGARGGSFEAVQAPGKRHLAEAVMMAKGLSICRKVDKIPPGRGRKESIGKMVTILKQVTECHLQPYGSIVKEDCDIALTGQTAEVR